MKFNRYKKSVTTALSVLGLTLFSACGSEDPRPMPVNTIPGAVAGASMCVPLGSPIGFNFSNVYSDSQSLMGGRGQGQIALTLGGAVLPTVAPGSMQLGSTNFEGTLMLNVLQNNQGQMNSASGNGFLQLSPTVIQTIQAQMGSFGFGFNSMTPTATATCVSGIAFDLSNNPPLRGQVYLYLNNSQQVYGPLVFGPQ